MEHSPTLQSLLQQSNALRYGNLDQLMAVSEKLLALAHQEKDIPAVLRALNNIGHACVWLHKYDRLFEVGEEARSLAVTHGDLIEKGYALHNLSSCYRHIGQTELAIDAIYELRQIAETHNHKELLCHAMIDLGILESIKLPDSFDTCRDYFLAAQDLMAESSVGIPLFMAYTDLAAISDTSQKYADAKAYAQQGFDNATEVGFVQGQIWSLHVLCTANAGLGDFAAAHAAIAQALKLSEQNKTPTYPTLSNLGYLQTLEGKYEDAIQTLQKTESLCVESKDYEQLTFVYLDMMNAYEQLKAYQKALEATQKYYQNQQRLYDEKTNIRIQVLQAVYEVEKTKQQLAQQQATEAERIKRHQAELTLQMQREMADIKQNLLIRLAHEFRTPLTVIQTSMELLTRYPEKLDIAKRNKYQDRVTVQIDHMEGLLDDILEVLRAPQLPLQEPAQTVAVESLCQQAIDAAYKKLKQSPSDRIQVALHPPDLQLPLDQYFVEQILAQLLNNALKFSTDTVQLTVRNTPDEIAFMVADRGIGIPSDEQEHVFDQLTRGSNIDEVPGTGLGLAIVQNHVQLLGGEIELDSREGEYTRVTIRLPHPVQQKKEAPTRGEPQ